MKLTKLIGRYCVDDPGQFRIADVDPADTAGLTKEEAKALLKKTTTRLAELQEKFYADGRWAMLAILQGMDASGKDSAIKHVMSGINPQGCLVHPFGPPSAEERKHDFLWRAVHALPARGQIGIFNRSHYEEVLVVRVHPELLEAQKLPPEVANENIWERRFESIRNFESHLAANGTAIVKFHLHISKEEQRRRFLKRLDQPAKRWKFSIGDLKDRACWDDYMHAYEDAIRETSTAEAPWYSIPADHKWFARLVIAGVLVETMEKLDLQYPEVAGAALDELLKVRETLRAEEETQGSVGSSAS